MPFFADTPLRRARRLLPCLAALLALALSACGGGGGNNGNTTANSQPQSITYPSSDADAQRFLTQATFGPTDADVAAVKTKGYEPWIDDQIKLEQTQTHVAYFDVRDAAIKAANASSAAWFSEVNNGFWAHALTADDQLRQRVAFALSQIFVVSSVDGCGSNYPRGTSSYLDMLADNAFGSFRNLLEKVSMHPIMGCYLSHLKNQRENAASGRVPDENYAREVMQLFTIGLYQLNADGTQKKDTSGNPIETYTANDVAGLAKVFTGFSWDCPDWPADNCFYYGANGNVKLTDIWSASMVGYPQFHSYAVDKAFLGVTIKATAKPDPTTDLKTALDFLALTHPNVGPFIGKQLIQRLVTSNPSAEYVGRVTAAFEASGRNMGAMIKAILTDTEARNTSAALASNTFGKVREPVLRLSAFMRAMGVTSDSGYYIIDPTDDVSALGQSPLRAPSVFNFYRPGYVYPGGASANAQLVAPELQIANESTVAGYINYMRDNISSGVGRSATVTVNGSSVTRRDVRLNYSLNTTNDWYLLAKQADSSALIELINQKLMYGTMPDALRTEIKGAVESITFSATPTEAQVRNRLQSALLLTVASPEFLVQK
jgi:uncharacterized protein (DUF1800 family)